MSRKVALIGYGAIAQHVIAALTSDPDVRVSQVLVRDHRVETTQVLLRPDIQVINSAKHLASDIDFVLECAGHDAVRIFGPQVLATGRDFGVISVGSLAEVETLASLRKACVVGRSQLSVLPGAIGGIDALAAAGQALEHVSYTSRKPPLSWLGSPAEETHDLKAMTQRTVVFSGSAREAATRFPKNANVVATVALAGTGFEHTSVSLIADPNATGNTHQITASGPLFDFSFQTSGAALPTNAKTSALTAFSAIRALKGRAPGILV